LILQQEREFKATFYSTSQESIANLAFHEGHGQHFRGGFFGNRGRGRFARSGGHNPKYCDHCHRTNHTSGNCWIKHGMPQGYHQNIKFHPPSSTLYTSMVDNASSPADLCARKDDKVEAQFGFSREQYKALLTLIQPFQNDSSPTTIIHQCSTKPTSFVFPFSFWIFDSGATDHIFPFKSLFQNLKPISPISI